MTMVAQRVGGVHPETAALANALADLGVVAAETEEPLSEALVFGIGGGLGGGYWLFEFDHSPVLVLGLSHLWQDPKALLLNTCKRLGVAAVVDETAGPKGAAKQLEAALAAGQTPLTWTDLGSLSYNALPPHLHGCFYHIVRVLGIEDGSALIDDRAPAPWRVPVAELTVARGTIATAKHRLLRLERPAGALPVRAAVEAGIRAGYEGLTSPPIKNFGLPAFLKFADLVANAKDKKGWPRVLPARPHLYRALVNLTFFIEANGTGGGAMRPLYATFLGEAAALLRRPALIAVAEQYRRLGGLWRALAVAALPDHSPALAEARRLMVRKAALFAERGSAASDEIAALQARLDQLEAAAAASFPLTASDVDDLQLDLRERLLVIVAAEREAADALIAAVW